MTYVRCIRNETLYEDDLAATYDPFLVVGRVYKVAPPHVNDGELLRIIDGEGEDYLYPADYFEPVRLNGERHNTATITIHLDPRIRDILQAESLAAQGFVSALVRDWIEDRLDLPT